MIYPGPNLASGFSYGVIYSDPVESRVFDALTADVISQSYSHVKNRSLFILLVLVLLLGSCGDTVIDPFRNDEKYYTVYGFLDILETSHSIRVIPVTRRGELIKDPTDPDARIDARVFSTDDFSGRRVEWTHSLEQLSDGTYGHIFTARFSPRAKRTYRLEVIRSDGKMTVAETTMPSIEGATILHRGPVVYSADSLEVYQDIVIPGVSSPWAIRAEYVWGFFTNNRTLVDYGRRGKRTKNGDWMVRMTYSEDRIPVQERVKWFFDQGILTESTPPTLTAVGLQIRVLDQNWDPPQGIFDPEVLAQPGTLSNVENGYGFFGSVGLYAEAWGTPQLGPVLGF